MTDTWSERDKFIQIIVDILWDWDPDWESATNPANKILALILSRLQNVTPEMVEAVAKVIDPEAWGLPPNLEDGTITDRDEARDHARAAITAYLAASPLNGGKL